MRYDASLAKRLYNNRMQPSDANMTETHLRASAADAYRYIDDRSSATRLETTAPHPHSLFVQLHGAPARERS